MGRKIILLSGIFASGIFLASCGGSGTAGSGTVTAYITDDPANTLKMLEVGVREIRIEGTPGSCVVFSAGSQSYRVDLLELQQTAQILDTTSCPAGVYTNVKVVLDRSGVSVIDQNGNSDSSCQLISYEGYTGSGVRNKIVCGTDSCEINIETQISVAESGNTDLIVDFVLEESEVNGIGTGSCTVTFEAEPREHKEVGESDELKGTVVSHDQQSGQFTIRTSGGIEVNVDYSGVTQQGIASIVDFAKNHSMKLEVECSSLDLSKGTCIAKEIELEVRGKMVSLSGTNVSIDIDGDGTADITVSASSIEGPTTTVGCNVEAEVESFDGATYVAEEVELWT